MDRKSTSGTCHMFSKSLVSWHSKKHVFVALSTAEAEYVAVSSCCVQILWLKQQLLDFDIKFSHIPIMCDNTSAINLIKNIVLHSKLNILRYATTSFVTMLKKGILCLSMLIVKIKLPIFSLNHSQQNLLPTNVGNWG